MGGIDGAIISASDLSGTAVALIGTANVVTVSGNQVFISGQPVLVSGQLVAVSGIVGANVSGNLIRIQAFDPSGTTWQDLWVSQSGGHDLRIFGSLSANVSGNAVRISGETVYPVSGKGFLYGFDPSGSTWNELWVSQSGGHDLRIFGSLSANVSGNVVYLASGQNPVQLYAYDPSGDTLQRLIVNASGSNILRVDAGSLSANVSGNVVYLVSGQNNVQMSGQLVAVSGIVGANVSGNVVYLVSGQNEITNMGFEPVTDTLKRLQVTTSGQAISGVFHRLIVAFSGDSVITSISGNMVSVSGQPAGISGSMVSISGQPVDISGEIVQPQIPQQIRTRDTLLITGASGGIALLSGDVLRVTVRNIGISGTVMYVGGSGDYPWVASGQANFPFQSGRGLWLRDGDGVTIHTSNMAFVRVVSHTSGEHVSYLGEQY